MIMSRPIQHQYPHKTPPPVTPTSPLDFTDRIPIEELTLSTETLGSGSYGTVFKAKWRNRDVAVKQFRTREEIDSFLVEVKQLSHVKHKNIVTLYGASTLHDTAYLIMEYAEGGSLNHLLHECELQKYDLSHACSWALQTARGVAYLHGIRPKPIMHRDLKPANLLLFSRGKTLKICDFGTACTVKTQMTNNTGSASYMAPEVFATSSYLESGDVFSWSIIFWEILARRQPYSQQYSNPYQILWRVKQEGTRPSELEDCPRIIWKLITNSWNKNPKERPTMREVAEQMAFIFSMIEKPTRSGNNLIQQQKSPERQPIPQFNRTNIQAGLSSVHINSSQSTSSSQETSMNNRRDQSIYIKLLEHKVYVLRKRYGELNSKAKCDKTSDSNDTFQEFEYLKTEFELRKEQLKQSRSVLNSPTSLNKKQPI